MNHRDYWRERSRVLEEAENRQGRECYEEIEQQYREAQRVIEGKIASWYQRFANNNGITMQQARQMLRGQELEEFRWEVSDYIRYGKENARTGAWMAQLENASARAHISRLESLKLQVQQSLETMFGNQLDSVDGTIRNIYKDSYYRTAYEIQKGIGVGWDFASIDNRKIEKVLKKPWAPDGKNFSERIWGNRQKLVNELHTELSRNIITGEDPQKAIRAIARKMKTSKTNAGRLVMTESAFFASAAQKECYQGLDVEYFEIVATLDSHTSEICRGMDGKHFPMSQYEAGVTAPPFHVNCRSCTCPYFDDEFDSVGKRAARKADGKVYYVPGNMKYREWQRSFVEGEKDGLQEAAPDDIIKAQEKVKQVAEELRVENFPSSFVAKGELKNTQALVDYVNSLEGADANVVALFNRMGKLENIESNGIPFTISHAKNHAVSTSTYTMSGNLAEAKLTIPKLQGDDLAGQVNTTLHEEMHLMDLYGREDPRKSSNWFSTSRKSLVDAFGRTSDSMSNDVANLFNEHNQEYKKVRDEVNRKYNQLISELNASMINRSFQGSYKDYKKQYNKLIAAKDAERDRMARNIMGGGIGNLQDIYDALSGGSFRDAGKVIYGHGSSYYRYTESRVHETIANYAALSVTRPDLIDLLRADKPELVAELEETIAELLKKAGDGR